MNQFKLWIKDTKVDIIKLREWLSSYGFTTTAYGISTWFNFIYYEGNMDNRIFTSMNGKLGFNELKIPEATFDNETRTLYLDGVSYPIIEEEKMNEKQSWTPMKIRLGEAIHRTSFSTWAVNNKLKSYGTSSIYSIVTDDRFYGVHISETGYISMFPNEKLYKGNNTPEYSFSYLTGIVTPLVPVEEPEPEPHVHAEHIHDFADNPKGQWQCKLKSCPDSFRNDWEDIAGNPNWVLHMDYRRKPVDIPKVYPKSWITDDELYSIYQSVAGPYMVKGLRKVADEAIKQYILDEESKTNQ